MTENTITQPTANTVRKDIHQQITDTILKQLEAGTVPWQQGWTTKSTAHCLPQNAITGKHYRGINIVLLWCASNEHKFTSHQWASFKQWSSVGQSIRKGEKGNMIVFTDTFEKEVDGEIKKIPFLKYSVVFNRSQLAKPDSEEIQPPESKVFQIDAVERFVSNTNALIKHHDGDAYYRITEDTIYLPHRENFIDAGKCSATENYYSTLMHELTHWTGHESRLNRKIKNKFGSAAYAEEELIAELGAAFLTAEFGITMPEKSNSADYIANWIKVLKENKQFVVSAANEAGEVVKYLDNKK
ncbi:MAG: zincin-like metallopeptidase domain-containing protein [Bacteroidetes bacterium]|nr:zincin-like metallopeptidase domain-containing protein [Bacteroidota bacterium]